MATITASRRGVLDDHVISASGPWSECSGCREANLLRLRDPEDEVVLQGPVDVNVSVYAEDELTAATGKVTVTRQPLMSHDISIPVGSSWRYGMGLLRGVGGNAGCTAWIRTARPQPDPLLVAAQDLPCDFAVRSIADTGEFFPSPCDPCEGGPVRVPPLDCGPAVDVLAARGGCVRPRYFNGMFISREDLEAEQRYFRIKMRMHNRAAGAGVVWGLDAALRGEHVVIGPGYGRDCCGNDVTITCDYAVPAASLLRDPLVCGSVRSCYALLLEYVECPEEPRPIHGDGCEPRQAGCEMSRIRETARLRLVTPAAASPTPLGRFWTRVEELIDGGGQTQTPVPVAGAGPAPAPADVPVPFSVVVTLGSDETLEPDRTATATATLNDVSATGIVSLRIVPESTGRGLAGSVSSGGTAVAVLSTNGASWSGTYGGAVTTLVYDIDWSVASPDVLRGRTQVQLVLAPGQVIKGEITDTAQGLLYTRWPDGAGLAPGDQVFVGEPDGLNMPSVVKDSVGDLIRIVSPPGMKPPPQPHDTVFIQRGSSLGIAIPPTDITMERTAPATPCCDGCCGAGAALPRPDRLRALLAALIYGRVVQSNTTLASDVGGARVLAVLRSFLGVPTQRLRDFEAAVAELYHAWCGAGVYSGPAPCDPDGVVLGCAHVIRGALCSVDPLDGRRWVIHQPLLDHWASSFGLDPLDRRIGELFRRLCCLSHLPGFGTLVDAGLPADDAPLSPALNHFVVGPAATAMVTGTSAPSALSALSTIGDLDLPTIAVLVDDLMCGSGAARTEVVREPDRPRTVVAEGFADLPTREQPRQALREAARDVARSVLAAVPAASAVGPDNPLAHVFASADITTLDDVLSVPEDTVSNLAIAVAAPEQIDAGLARAQETARRVVGIVAESLQELESPQVTRPEQLGEDDVAQGLAVAVARRLGDEAIEIDADALAAAIKAGRH